MRRVPPNGPANGAGFRYTRAYGKADGSMEVALLPNVNLNPRYRYHFPTGVHCSEEGNSPGNSPYNGNKDDHREGEHDTWALRSKQTAVGYCGSGLQTLRKE